MKDNLVTLPIWKKGASASERLEELSLLAREMPERFEKFVICYRETTSGGRWKYRTLDYGCDMEGKVAMFEMGKDQTIRESES